jgi:hypothetical protein
LAKQVYEEIGDGYVVRVDSVRGPGGESRFEVHVYKDSKAFQKAATIGDADGLRKAEVNTLKTNGEWGKHGKPNEAPDLGKNGNEGFNKVVQREMEGRSWLTKTPEGHWELRENIRKNLGKYSRFLGPAGMVLEYTRSSVDRACELDSSNDAC